MSSSMKASPPVLWFAWEQCPDPDEGVHPRSGQASRLCHSETGALWSRSRLVELLCWLWMQTCQYKQELYGNYHSRYRLFNGLWIYNVMVQHKLCDQVKAGACHCFMPVQLSHFTAHFFVGSFLRRFYNSHNWDHPNDHYFSTSVAKFIIILAKYHKKT